MAIPIFKPPETPEYIEKLLELSHRKSFPAKNMILRQGDQATELLYVVEGSVTVLLEDEKGHEIILAYLNEGEFFGELGLFEEENTRVAFVRGRTACEIAYISYDKVRNLSKQYPDLLFQISRQVAKRLKKTNRKVGDLAFMDVSGRVARTLLDLCKEPDAMTHPDGMQIKITRQELGRIVGCSREMVGRVLKGLEEQLLITVAGKTIVVLGVR